MNIAQLPRLPDTDFSAFSSAGRQKVNEDIDQYLDRLPERYVVTEKRVNKALLFEDLSKGVQVEHAHLTNGADIFTIRGK